MTHYARRVVICCLLALAAPGCESSGPSMPSPAEELPRHVVVLGDSLAVSPSPALGFPSELQARIERDGLPWRVISASASGDTTGDGLRRLGPLLDSTVGVLVVALGANDGLQGSSLSTIESNLSAIIERAQARGIQVLLCGMETPPVHGFDYSLAFHFLFPRLASRYDVPLVPFLLAGVALDPDFNGPDLIHPNAAGARRIADTVWPYLRPLLLQGSGLGTRGSGLGLEGSTRCYCSV